MLARALSAQGEARLDADSGPRLLALQRACLHEEQQNIKCMKVRSTVIGQRWSLICQFFGLNLVDPLPQTVSLQQRSGDPLHYGESFQLQHVLSQKVLTVRLNEASVVEPHNFLMELQTHGSAQSELCFLPRLKVDEEVFIFTKKSPDFVNSL